MNTFTQYTANTLALLRNPWIFASKQILAKGPKLLGKKFCLCYVAIGAVGVLYHEYKTSSYSNFLSSNYKSLRGRLTCFMDPCKFHAQNLIKNESDLLKNFRGQTKIQTTDGVGNFYEISVNKNVILTPEIIAAFIQEKINEDKDNSKPVLDHTKIQLTIGGRNLVMDNFKLKDIRPNTLIVNNITIPIKNIIHKDSLETQFLKETSTLIESTISENTKEKRTIHFYIHSTGEAQNSANKAALWYSALKASRMQTEKMKGHSSFNVKINTSFRQTIN